VTRVAIKEARSREITDQLARSDRLKVLFYAKLTAALVYQLFIFVDCATADGDVQLVLSDSCTLHVCQAFSQYRKQRLHFRVCVCVCVITVYLCL